MQTKIPKIIHYCWFGESPLPDKVKENILTWKSFCPDYKIIQWNDSTFDYCQSYYSKSAYDNHEWAFLSDYARLVCLEEYGGIYLDTDVELIKNLDSLLCNKMFTGFENSDAVATGLICGSVPHNENIRNLLSVYKERGKNIVDGRFDRTSCVEITTDYFFSKGLKLKNENQKVNGCFIYKKEFFCPQSPGTKKIKITKNTYSIHHYSGSWLDSSGVKGYLQYRSIYLKAFFRRTLTKLIGRKGMKKIQKIFRSYSK